MSTMRALFSVAAWPVAIAVAEVMIEVGYKKSHGGGMLGSQTAFLVLALGFLSGIPNLLKVARAASNSTSWYVGYAVLIPLAMTITLLVCTYLALLLELQPSRQEDEKGSKATPPHTGQHKGRG
jgi:hypothetical protein